MRTAPALWCAVLAAAFRAISPCAASRASSTPEAAHRAEELTAASRAAAEEEDAQITTRVLRLMDSQIDRFLTDVTEGEKERKHNPGDTVGEITFEEHTNQQAKLLVKRISKNLKMLGTTVLKFEGAVKARKADQENKEAEINRLERVISEMKDTDTQERELMDLRAEKKQLLSDKEAMVKTVQELMRKTQGVHAVNNTLRAQKGAEERETQIQNEYQDRINNLEAEVAKAKKETENREAEVEEAKKKNLDAKAMLETANLTSEELRKDQSALRQTLEQIQEENDGLVKDKGELMGTLRSLLSQNTALRRQAAAATRALEKSKSPPSREEQSTAPTPMQTSSSKPEPRRAFLSTDASKVIELLDGTAKMRAAESA